MIRRLAAHPTAANALMLATLALGLAALPGLQRDTFPLVPPSQVEVTIGYPGAAPAEVESGICEVVEDPVRAVDNLLEVSCLARENIALVTAEMIEGADMDRFYEDVKTAIGGVDSLPDKAKEPVTGIVERIATVSSVAVTGPDDPHVLFAYADALAERLKTDPEISQVSIGGFSDREVVVEISATALARHGLTLDGVATVLARSSLDLPAGTLENQQSEALIRFVEQRRSAAELASIPVAASVAGGEVLLGEIARIDARFADPAQATYYNGQRAAILTVAKTATQDALRVKAALDRQLAAAQAEAPGNIGIAIATDTTSNIRDRLRIITENGIQGLLLVLVTMWLFFGFRFSFWVAMGLPVSFLGAIFAFQLFGLTLNMMTMVALLVAIGLLMDDAIVISENIVRRRREGESALEAAVNGTVQVAPGVVSSFLTTVIVLAPLGYLTGNIGAILKYIPIALIITLVVSLFEAFFILPAHLHHTLNRDIEPGRITAWVNRLFEALRDRVIVPLSRLSLKYRYLTLGLAGFLLLISLAPYSGGWIKYRSFPVLESDTVEARLLLAQGAPLARTEARVAKVVAALEKMNEDWTPLQPGGAPLVEGYTVTYSANSDTPEVGAHMATISARLLPAGQRNTTVTDIVDQWKKLTGPMPDMVSIRFTDKERGAGGKPIDLRLQSGDLDALAKTANELRKFFRSFAGVRDVTYDLHPGKPEFIVTVKSAAASALGVTPQAIAAELRAAFRGDTGLELRDGLGALEIVARLAVDDRRRASDIADIRVPGSEGAMVPLSAVAEITEARGFGSINRIDGQRTVQVQGSINPEIANASELMAALKADFLPDLAEKRPDMRVTIMGEARDTATTGASLVRNMALGLIGVYLMLAIQFGSFVQPLAVISVIPMSLVGVIWGHMALGLQISLPSLVGLATLAGVVVNDTILLVGFMKDRLAEGEAMIEAGVGAVRDRFRAIFLTSLTTVVGLGPLLFEPSTQAQFLRPIVASLAFGLSGATLIALFLAPAVFAILNDLRQPFARKAPAQAVTE